MPDGIVIIDKPSGWTSMDVCARLRGVFHEKRVGHAGTLDPMATGVLPVFVGKATKAVSFAENGKKEYEAVLKLGLETDTQDVTGQVLARSAVGVTRGEIEAVLPRFTGEIEQIPPMYSAVKINGRKLCDLARRGCTVAREPRKITVYSLQLGERLGQEEYALHVRCSKGTYVRTLCRDIGAALGCGGCMAALRRTEASGFTIAEAVTLDEAERKKEAALVPLSDYFRDYPALTLADPAKERLCRNGGAVPFDTAAGTYRVFGGDGTFLSLSEAKDGVLTAIKNFF